MTGMAAIAFCAAFTSCSKGDDIYDPNRTQTSDNTNASYAEAFIKTFGKPAADQDWGFGTVAGTRSQAAPEVADIPAPFDEAWVAEYNETAKEPNETNVADNFDNSRYDTNWTVVNSAEAWEANDGKDRNYFCGDDGNSDTWEQRVAWALENHPTWVTKVEDETYVTNFKITGTWDGGISVAGSEGIMDDGTLSSAERTIVVTGTWNITNGQTIGSLGKIIIANGGTVNVAEGQTLNMVNEARLVVLAGGKLTGAGKVEVNNGNAAGEENYNAGTIDVAVFNNNFGKFYNHGKFLVNEYQGGAQESNFYNHTLAAIDHFGGSTANARIFNGCQFYVKNDARIRNYEGKAGSALIVGGELMFSGSEDGTSTPSYVGLAAGALVKAGELYNNGTSWTGPTENYAAISVGKITFLNWQQDAPQTGGYFINNIYVQADDWTNAPGGNGMAGEDALTKFQNVQNAGGNGNVEIVEKGDYEVIPADPDFKQGEAGCSPGFSIKKDDNPDPDPNYTIRVIGEDLSAQEEGDFDFNDVVFDVALNVPGKTYIKLKAAGGTLPLIVGVENPQSGEDYSANEVHHLYGKSTKTMINTRVSQKPELIAQGVAYADGLDDVILVLDKSYSNAKLIPIYVQKNNEWIVLTADKGQPASKIGVTTNFNWVTETEFIGAENWYPLFTNWVQHNNGDWYQGNNENK